MYLKYLCLFVPAIYKLAKGKFLLLRRFKGRRDIEANFVSRYMNCSDLIVFHQQT